MAWVPALAAPLHRRLAGRLAEVVSGILMASERRTAACWWRAAAIGDRFQSPSSFRDAVGRKVADWAAMLVRIVLDRIDSRERLVVALDDTPTERSGPKVPGAGIHPNPTPGPAGSARGRPPGQKRGRGRPPSDGKTRLSLAQRAGQARGWQTVEARTTTGPVLRKRIKTGLATGRPAGGVVRVVSVTEDDGSWRAWLGTDPEASVAAVVQVALACWGIEPHYHDLKEGASLKPVPWRRV